MSFKDVLKALGAGLKPTHKLVLVVIASFANHKTGRCNPKICTIAKGASMSARNVHRILRPLEEGGHLIIKRNFEGKGRLPSSYTVVELANSPGARDPQRASQLKNEAARVIRGHDPVGRTNNHNLNQAIYIHADRNIVRSLRTKCGPEHGRDQACQVELARRLDPRLGWEMLMESEDQLGILCAKVRLGTITAADLEQVRQTFRLKAAKG